MGNWLRNSFTLVCTMALKCVHCDTVAISKLVLLIVISRKKYLYRLYLANVKYVFVDGIIMLLFERIFVTV